MTGIARDMVESVAQRLGDREEAIRAVRAVLRFFGGQLIYFPQSAREDSKQVMHLRDVLTDEIGGVDAERFIEAWAKYWGGSQQYMPLEQSAFRDEIADEIYARFDGSMDTMGDLCREYKTSYVNIYRLYHKGQSRARTGQRDLFDEAEAL
jgi:Mor family transcriptional regulator